MHKSKFKFNYQIKMQVKSPTEDQDCETCTVWSSVLNTSQVMKDEWINHSGKLRYFEDVSHSVTLPTITHTSPK